MAIFRFPTCKVTMFAPNDVHSLEISVMDALCEANRNAGQPLYELCVVAETKDPIRYAPGLLIVPDWAIGDFSPMPDTFVVGGSYSLPAGAHDGFRAKWESR
jgi:transcriptional regulator GlxA family with amidase domain